MYSYIINFTWEIWVKWTTTRWNYIKKLANNIESRVWENIISIEYKFDKIFLYAEKNVDNILSTTFGISKFSSFEKKTFTNFDDLINKSYDFFESKIKWIDFRVKCKRKGSHNFSSVDIEKKLWENLSWLGNVNLKNPWYIANLEIQWNDLYLFDNFQLWPWGYPVWWAWKVVVLMSWWVDSVVAAWKAYKMWLDVDFLYFSLWENDVYDSVVELVNFMKYNWGVPNRWNLFVWDFSFLLEEIVKIKKSYRNLVLKYFFYTITNRFCSYKKIKWFVTWEAISQVSTQVLENLSALDTFTNNLVLRPVICMPKSEIITLAKQIWVFDLIYQWKEHCSVSGKWAETKWTVFKIQNQIDLLWEGVSQKIFESISKVNPKNNFMHTQKFDYKDRYIIYVQKDRNESMESAINVPFEKYKTILGYLDDSKKYVVTCRYWKLSNVVCDFLWNNWFDVVVW